MILQYLYFTSYIWFNGDLLSNVFALFYIYGDGMSKLKRVCEACKGRAKIVGMGMMETKCTYCVSGWIDIVEESLRDPCSENHLLIRELPKNIPKKNFLVTEAHVTSSGATVEMYTPDFATTTPPKRRGRPARKDATV